MWTFAESDVDVGLVHSSGCCRVHVEKHADDGWFRGGLHVCAAHNPDPALALAWADGIAGATVANTGCIERPVTLPGATFEDWTIEFTPETWAQCIEDWYALPAEERDARTSPERRLIPHAVNPPTENPHVSRVRYQQTGMFAAALIELDPIRRKDMSWSTVYVHARSVGLEVG